MERFWEKVDRRGDDECWTWQASFVRGGYGQFVFEGVSRRANRVAWVLTNGPIAEGMCVCHRCDNPPCVNPAHLFLGTRLDNTRDMDAKGRRVTKARPGELSNTAKLREADVARIRALYATTLFSQKELAELYELSQTNISAIIRGQTWTATSQGTLRRPGWSKLKLTAEKVTEIRKLRIEGMRQSAIAARFGVSQTQISHIVRGEHWRHV